MATANQKVVSSTPVTSSDNGMSPNVVSSTPVTNSCWKKQQRDENESFWGNFKNQLHVFTHTPMEDHKTCFKLTMLAMKDKFSSSKSELKAQETSSD